MPSMKRIATLLVVSAVLTIVVVPDPLAFLHWAVTSGMDAALRMVPAPLWFVMAAVLLYSWLTLARAR